MDPTYIIGGKVSSFESNANLGSGRHILAEADESDGSFLLFTPDKAVITSIDSDHLEAYGQSVKKLEFSFIEFIQKVKKKVFIHDEKKALIKNLTSELNIFTYGFDMHSDFQILDFFQNEQGSFFSLKDKINDTLFDFEINMHGRHNVLNTVAAIIVSLMKE